MLRAAREAFVEHGYHGATMADIAERSGFAVQTISYFFGTKPRLLSGLIEASVRRAMGDTPPLDHDAWHARMAQHPDGPTILDDFVDGVHPVLVDVAAILEVARIGAMTDPEVADVFDFHEHWRVTDYTKLVNWLVERDALRPGLAAARAVDTLVTICGPEVYDTLQARRGWPTDEIREWMRDTLKRLLLPMG